MRTLWRLQRFLSVIISTLSIFSIALMTLVLEMTTLRATLFLFAAWRARFRRAVRWNRAAVRHPLLRPVSAQAVVSDLIMVVKCTRLIMWRIMVLFGWMKIWILKVLDPLLKILVTRKVIASISLGPKQNRFARKGGGCPNQTNLMNLRD